MARRASSTLTERESQVMDVVWRLGEATAEQVRAGLPKPLHDSTVRTVLRVLESKGQVCHETRGKTFVYRALAGREKAQRHALRDVLARFFGGSAQDLVLRLIEDEAITAEQLEELRRAAPAPGRKEAARRGRSGGGGREGGGGSGRNRKRGDGGGLKGGSLGEKP